MQSAVYLLTVYLIHKANTTRQWTRWFINHAFLSVVFKYLWIDPGDSNLKTYDIVQYLIGTRTDFVLASWNNEIYCKLSKDKMIILGIIWLCDTLLTVWTDQSQHFKPIG